MIRRRGDDRRTDPEWVERERARSREMLDEARRILATMPRVTTERGIGWVIHFPKNRKKREERDNRRS
jgi:hypothetical protein